MKGEFDVARVIANEKLAPGIYRLTAEGDYRAESGQFYMLRCWEAFPVLSRPISIHDIGPGTISFLYRVGGTGTRLLSELRPGDHLRLEGPFGQGFPKPEGRTAIVGGGMGVAPLLLAARRMQGAKVFLGFSGEPFGVSRFRGAHPDVTVVSGGTVADSVEPAVYDTIFACGPVPLMAQLARKAEGTGARLYVSVEKRMACGLGACNGCAVAGNGAYRKACVEGPVFSAGEVDFHDLLSL